MKEQVPIFLINLDRAPERLEFLGSRLEALGLAFTRISAVDGGTLSDAERAAFSAKRVRSGRYDWLPGQIGCFLSHMDAWQRAASGSALWTLILEDDLHISNSLRTVLQQSSRLPSDADIVRLEGTDQWLKLGPVSGEIDNRTIRRVASTAWGAGAYLLSKPAATRLINSKPSRHSPVDDFLFNIGSFGYANELITYQVLPALASQDKFNGNQNDVKGFGSAIEPGRVNARLVGISKWRRAITSRLRGKTRILIK